MPRCRTRPRCAAPATTCAPSPQSTSREALVASARGEWTSGRGQACPHRRGKAGVDIPRGGSPSAPRALGHGRVRSRPGPPAAAERLDPEARERPGAARRSVPVLVVTDAGSSSDPGHKWPPCHGQLPGAPCSAGLGPRTPAASPRGWPAVLPGWPFGSPGWPAARTERESGSPTPPGCRRAAPELPGRAPRSAGCDLETGSCGLPVPWCSGCQPAAWPQPCRPRCCARGHRVPRGLPGERPLPSLPSR